MSSPSGPAFLVLQYPPSANAYWRSRIVKPKNGAAFVSHYVSEEATAYKADVGRRIMLSRTPKLTGHVELACVLYPNRPLDWATRARKAPNEWQYTVSSLDLDNACKVLIDALKGVLFDDDRVIEKLTMERGVPDERGPRVVVGVRPWVPAIVQPTLDLALPVLPATESEVPLPQREVRQQHKPATRRRVNPLDVVDSPF